MTEESAAYLHYTQLENARGELTDERIATLVLNRHEAANAFSGQLLVKIKELLDAVEADSTVRILLLQGSGRHFSAGADLNWMKSAARLEYSENLREAEKLSAMFEALVSLKIPTLALVKGAAFGGAVGLVAACDFAFALENARFCLSEVKIGLVPAVILPYLGRTFEAGALRRMMLSARVFGANEAKSMGLIQSVVSADEVEALLHEELNLLLAASPEAQILVKKLHRQLAFNSWAQSSDTVTAIAQIRASAMGQEGLAAFFQKSEPNWLRLVPKNSRLFIP